MTTWPGTARPPSLGLVPITVPAHFALSTSETRTSKPAAVSAARQESTPEHQGTATVSPRSTRGSAGGKSLLPRAARIGAMASCQIVAPLPPPKPPTSSLRLGLSTMTLAAISGV